MVAVDPERVKQITECLKLRKETVADEVNLNYYSGR